VSAITRKVLTTVLMTLGMLLAPMSVIVVAGTTELGQRVVAEATEVCVVFPNEFDLPALAEVRAPQVVRYRYLNRQGQSPAALLWLPDEPMMVVRRLVVVPAPPLPNHCAIPLSWPE
jgi:hypothetical protein